jgi:hypothetical protein
MSLRSLSLSESLLTGVLSGLSFKIFYGGVNLKQGSIIAAEAIGADLIGQFVYKSLPLPKLLRHFRSGNVDLIGGFLFAVARFSEDLIKNRAPASTLTRLRMMLVDFLIFVGAQGFSVCLVSPKLSLASAKDMLVPSKDILGNLPVVSIGPVKQSPVSEDEL